MSDKSEETVFWEAPEEAGDLAMDVMTEMVQRVLFGEPNAAKPQKSKAPAQDAAEAAG